MSCRPDHKVLRQFKRNIVINIAAPHHPVGSAIQADSWNKAACRNLPTRVTRVAFTVAVNGALQSFDNFGRG